jgi:hypothetical protein
MSPTPWKMSSPAYIVEGDLEQAFLKNVCPGAPIRKIGCNGDDVALRTLAKFIGTQGRLLQKRYRPLIIVFDREGRCKPCDQIETEIREYLLDESISVEIIIGIPDREIENWILADAISFCSCTRTDRNALESNYEGKGGKAAIKSLLSHGSVYVETSDGPSWLKKCRPTRMAAASESFRRFYDHIKEMQCWWLKESNDEQ